MCAHVCVGVCLHVCGLGVFMCIHVCVCACVHLYVCLFHFSFISLSIGENEGTDISYKLNLIFLEKDLKGKGTEVIPAHCHPLGDIRLQNTPPQKRKKKI